jgi:hypothetical protein
MMDSMTQKKKFRIGFSFEKAIMANSFNAHRLKPFWQRNITYQIR